jgi:hypothetical protein
VCLADGKEEEKKPKKKPVIEPGRVVLTKEKILLQAPAVVFPSSTASLMSPPIVNALFQVLYTVVHYGN